MNREVRRIVENGKGRQIGRVIESDRKRKLLAQNVQKVGILFIPKESPGIPTGLLCLLYREISDQNDHQDTTK